LAVKGGKSVEIEPHGSVSHRTGHEVRTSGFLFWATGTKDSQGRQIVKRGRTCGGIGTKKALSSDVEKL